jgi:hypothetical protein
MMSGKQVDRKHTTKGNRGISKKLNKTPKILLLWLLLLWLFVDFACVHCNSSDLEQKPKEGIYVYMFFAFPPTGETLIVKNVHLSFTNVSSPINTAIPAFDELIECKCEIIRVGWKCFVSVMSRYPSGVANANQHADVVANEFLRVFNKTGLSSIHKAQKIDDTTNTIRLWRQFGYMDYQVFQVEPFLRYKPSMGFADLVTRDFLSKYVPGTDIIGLVDLYYRGTKNGSTFSWEFVIGASEAKLTFGTEETINLNELLNNSLPIHASTKQSEIRIDIEKTTTRKIHDTIETYTLTLKDIYPDSCHLIEEQIRYEDLTTPVDNVIVTVKVEVKKVKDNDLIFIALIAVGVSAGVITTIAIFLKKIKKFKEEKTPLQYKNKSM